MRRIPSIAVLLTAAVSTQGASYEARTPHHEVTVEMTSVTPGQVSFHVTVVNMPSAQILTSVRLAGTSDTELLRDVDVDGQHVSIRVGLLSTRLVCEVEIDKEDVMVDSIQSSWATAPVHSPHAAGIAPFRVGGDVKPPVLLNRVEPIYPAAARKARISGIVIVEAFIDRAGVVKEVQILKPLPFGLSEAAVDAVKQWRFRPGTLHGRPVDVKFDLTVNFRIAEPAPVPPPG